VRDELKQKEGGKSTQRRPSPGAGEVAEISRDSGDLRWFSGGRAVWWWRKRGGVLLWTLHRGESGRAKGITNAVATVLKLKQGKGEEGGPAQRCHMVGRGRPVVGDARQCVVRQGWIALRCGAVLKQGKNEREGTLTRGPAPV
jgi:hypothetical protein